MLLQHKTDNLYKRALLALCELTDTEELMPHTVMVDFEKSFHNALRADFGNIVISGCFFQFGQCI